jgi:hypothetical protein
MTARLAPTIIAGMIMIIDNKLRFISWRKPECGVPEEQQEQARQAATVLPSPEVLNKIMRYETTLERQLHRAMNSLERLRRRRLSEAVPPRWRWRFRKEIDSKSAFLPTEPILNT